MKKIGALLVILLFITSSFALSGKTTTKETVIAKITYRNEECPISTLQPIVVITQPEDGAVVTDPHLVVLGYAIDEAGMNYWEWEWHWKGGHYTNSSYFETAEYVEFKIDIYGLKEGWNLIIVRFRNIYGAWGEDSVNVTYVPENNPPNKPSPPEGPTEGKVEETLYFNTVTTDPDGDPLEYLIDWGDGTNTGWVGPIASGTPFETFHAWEQPGTYEVKAKARDIPYHQESDWSEPLIVTIYGNDTPVVVIEHPENGTVFTEPNITVIGYAEDDSAIVSIGYIHEWESGSTEDSWAVEPAKKVAFEIPITLRAGKNAITVYAVDDVENIGYDKIIVWYNISFIELKSVFQPVQVVWQDAPPTKNRNRLREIVAGKHYRADIPMVKEKNTLIFGYPFSNRKQIEVTITNKYDIDRKIKLQFRIQPDDKIIYTHPRIITIKKGATVTEKIDPENISAFKWGESGGGSVVLEAISADGKPLNSNDVVVEVDIKETHGFSILYIPVRLENTKMLYLVGDVDKMIEVSDEFMQGAYPVPEDSIFGRDLMGEIARNAPWGAKAEDWLRKYIPQLNFGNPPTNAAQLERQIDNIINRLTELITKFGFKRAVALVPENWFNNWASVDEDWRDTVGVTWHIVTRDATGKVIRRDPLPVAIVEYPYPTAVAHEIGHSFGLRLDGEEYNRTSDGKDAYGYWVNKGEEKNDKICFMGRGPRGLNSVCERWICIECYENLINRLQAPDPEILFISGRINNDGSAFINKTIRISEGYPDISSSEGEYYIVLLNNGNVLSQYGFGASIETTGVDFSIEGYFAFRVPWAEGTNRIQIRDAQGNILAEKIVSKNSPTVTVIYPNGGEEISPGNCTITWTAYDQDGDELTYDVMISTDGKNWIPLGMDLTTNSYTCDFSVFPAGKYLIKVIASDGVNTGQDISDSTFTILPDTIPPSIKIVQPERGIYINDRKIIPFPFTIIIGKITITAEAEDNVGIINVSFYVDNQLKNASYTPPYSWTWDEFVMGWHEIKVVAYDFSGNTAIDKRKVLIFNI